MVKNERNVLSLLEWVAPRAYATIVCNLLSCECRTALSSSTCMVSCSGSCAFLVRASVQP